MSCQRRGLLLFHLLAFLLFLSFSSAQSSNTTSDFVLTVPETLLLCQVVELSWSSANDTVPLYEVYLATGSGAIGDSNSLSPETWIAAVGNTTLEWQLKPVWGKSCHTKSSLFTNNRKFVTLSHCRRCYKVSGAAARGKRP